MRANLRKGCEGGLKMIDEKDLEIARLRGQLEARQARQAHQASKGGAAVGTLKVLATLAAAVRRLACGVS